MSRISAEPRSIINTPNPTRLNAILWHTQKKNMVRGIRYFSTMRPFAELQIAKQFAAFPQYHDVFRSCNRGSKQNIWCAACAKCLFVFSVLSPFIEYGRLCEIFGSDMLDNPALQADFDGLVGLSPVKPFECVGTVNEIRSALTLTAEKQKKKTDPFPLCSRISARR